MGRRTESEQACIHVITPEVRTGSVATTLTSAGRAEILVENSVGTCSHGLPFIPVIFLVFLTVLVAVLVLVPMTTAGGQPPSAHIDSIDPDPAYDTQQVSFQGHAEETDGRNIAYRWESDIDGKLSEEANFQISGLSPGSHTIIFKVREDKGNSTPWSESDIHILEVNHNELPLPEDIGVSAPWVYRGQSVRVYANGSDDLTGEAELSPEFNYQVPETQRYAWRARFPILKCPAISKDGEYIALGTGNNINLYHKDSDIALWSWPIQGNVWYMDISDEGAYITAGTGLGNIYLFDRSRPTPLWSYTIDASSNTIAMSANGNYVVTGSTAGTIYLFHRESPTPLWTYSIGNYNVANVEISADGQYIVAAGWDQTLYLFHRNSSEPLWTFVKPAQVAPFGLFYPVGISADGQYIAAGWGYLEMEGAICYFHRDNATLLWNYSIGPDTPWSLDFTPDGQYIAAGTQFGDVLLFHRDGGAPLWRYQTGSTVNAIAISADGTHIAAGNQDGKVYMFHRDSQTPLWNCDIGAATELDYLRISGDGDTVVASNIQGMFHVFHRDSGGSYWSHTIDDSVKDCAISGDGEYIVAGGYDHRVYLFHRGNSDPLWSHPVTGEFVASVDMSDDGRYIAAVSGTSRAYYGGPGVEDQKVYLFQRDNEIPLWSHGVGKRRSNVVISSDGAYIAVGSRGAQNVSKDKNETGKIHLFHRDSDEPVWIYPVPGNNTGISLDISADGQYISAGRSQSELGVVGDETLVYLFHRDSPVPLWTYNYPDEFNWRVAISANGEYITAGNDNGTVAFFHRDSPEPLWTYGTGGRVGQPVISTNGEYIATGSSNGKVCLFHRDDSTPLWTFEVEQAPILTLSADGEYLTVGSVDQIYFFHRDSSTPLWTYTVGGDVAGVAISAHGEEVTVACYDRKVYLLQGSSSTYLSDPVHTGQGWSVDFSPSLSAPLGDYHIRVRFADPHEGVGDWRYTLLDSTSYLEPVEVRNNPPVASISSVFPSSINDGEAVSFNGTGWDIDGDMKIVAYQWRSSISGIFGNTANLSYQGLSPGEHEIAFRVLDSDGGWSEEANMTIHVNAFPVATITGDYPRSVGHNETIVLQCQANDSDGSIVTYEWYSSIDGILSTEANCTVANLTNGTHIIELRVQDEDGAWSTSDKLTLSVSAPPPSSSESQPSLWLIIPFSALLLVGGSMVTWTVMRSKEREEEALYLVEDVFLIYRRDGCLMIHERQSGRELIDEDVLGGMLTAMMMFIKDSFERSGFLQGMEFGDSKVLIDVGKHSYLAVLVFGFPGPELKEQMEEVLRSVETAFASTIEDWDGKRETFKDASGFLTPLLTGTSDITRAMVEAQVDARKVRILSEWEFVKGFVRLNVAIKNNTVSPMSDTVFKLKYDTMVFGLEKVEPDHPLAKGALHLGTLEPGEEKIMAFFLDPLVCKASVLDGDIIYRIGDGRRRKAFMKQRKVDVSCPVFVTTENVTLPMVRALLEEELACRDSRTIHVPESASQEEVYTMVKDALQGHNLQFLREQTDGQESSGEAGEESIVVGWFYGLTRAESNHVVIQAIHSQKKSELQLIVASIIWPAVTGMLAELRRSLGFLVKEKAKKR